MTGDSLVTAREKTRVAAIQKGINAEILRKFAAV
jgi:hypothetical protein